MLLLNQADDDKLSQVIELLLLRYAIIAVGVLVLAVVAFLVLRAWLRRGNRISDGARGRVHDVIDRRLGERRGVRAIAHTTWDAVSRDRDDPPRR